MGRMRLWCRTLPHPQPPGVCCTGETEIFSYKTTPFMVVSDAVRISMSIPLVYKPHYKLALPCTHLPCPPSI